MVLCAEGSKGLDRGRGSDSAERFLGICAPGILGTGGNATLGSNCELSESDDCVLRSPFNPGPRGLMGCGCNRSIVDCRGG